MRGSSSPVELRHTISDAAGPSSVPSKTVDLPDVKAETIDEADLEEGEVVSPVRRPIEPTGLSSSSVRPGDRWAPPRRRGSLSPRKQPFRSRPPSPDRRDWDRDRDRDRDRPRDWRDRRRSLSPVLGRPKFERQDSARFTEPGPAVNHQPNDPSPERQPRARSPPRPSTPPIPSDLESEHANASRKLEDLAAPPRPDTPILPESQASEDAHGGQEETKKEFQQAQQSDRPHTPDLPASPAPAERTTRAIASALDETIVAAGVVDHAPSLPSSIDGRSARAGDNRPPIPVPDEEDAPPPVSLVATTPPRQDPPPSHEVEPTSPSDTAVTPALDDRSGSPRVEVVQDPSSSGSKVDVDMPVEELLVKLADNEDDAGTGRAESALQQLISPPTSRVTIAERRSVKLPDTAVPLSSPFNARIRKDSMPTAGSGHTSTDAETEDGGPRTAEIRDEPPSANLSDGAVEELKRVNIALAIKRFSKPDKPKVVEAVYACNAKVAPTPSSRVPKSQKDFDPDRRLRQITWPLSTKQQSVAQLVSVKIQHERQWIDIKLKDLRAQYKSLQEEWEKHCKGLDAQMEKRAPPPADLYDIPNAFKPPPVTGPGSVLPSPSVEEPSAIGRANRRRGGGDFVATDADLEEIMANLKQMDDQDPTFRARKTTATVPDMLLGPEKLGRYDDDNDLVDDPLAFYDFAGRLEPIWTQEEKDVFRRVYPNCGKQFGKVADKLPNKSVGDCVQYYYRTKKEIDWKGLVAAKRGGERKRGRGAAAVGATGKKPGKSSALLADLERQKPTVNPNSTGPGKSTITPARPGKGPRQRDAGNGTPSEAGGGGGGKRRKTNMLDAAAALTVDGLSSEATSRAGSEAPSAKAKMRMSIKGKRPRVSSVTGLSAMTTTDPLLSGVPLDPNGPAPTPLTAPVDHQAELLPPPKRPGKRRKMVAIDPNAPDAPAAGMNPGAGAGAGAGDKPDGSKPRRSNTNSYWSVDEKKQVRALHMTLGDDMEQIASHIPGKSVRQVTNFLASRVGPAGDASIETEDKGGVGVSAVSLKSFLPVFVGTDQHSQGPPRAASYDIYGNDHSDRKFQQPRLGTFPTAPGSGPGRSASPTKPFSRPGGMQISALLNNDESSASFGNGKPNLDALEAASDGTVEDEGMARPPSRSFPHPASRQPPISENPHRPPDLDRYKTRPYESAFQPRPSPAYYPPPPPPGSRADYPHAPQQQHRGGWDHHPPSYHYPGAAPQMGVFGPAPPSSSAPGAGGGGTPYQGRTVYSAKLEQEMGLPPPRNRGRSDGPAFSGYPPHGPPPRPGPDQAPSSR